MKSILLTMLMLLAIQAKGELTFTHTTATGAKIDFNEPVCVYLLGKYRPVTKLAGKYGCSNKADIALFRATGKRLVKHNRKSLGDIYHAEIENAYLKSMK